MKQHYRVIDTVLPAAKTSLEEFERWQNSLSSQLHSLPYYHKKKINVQYVDTSSPQYQRRMALLDDAQAVIQEFAPGRSRDDERFDTDR